MTLKEKTLANMVAIILGVSDPANTCEIAGATGKSQCGSRMFLMVGVDWFVEDEGIVALGFRDHTCLPLSDPGLSTIEDC